MEKLMLDVGGEGVDGNVGSAKTGNEMKKPRPVVEAVTDCGKKFSGA